MKIVLAFLLSLLAVPVLADTPKTNPPKVATPVSSSSVTKAAEAKIQADWVIVLYQVNWKNEYTPDMVMYVVGEFNSREDCERGGVVVAKEFSLGNGLTARCTRHFH